MALRGPVFFRLAWRLPAYQGAVRQVLIAQQSEDQQNQPRGQWPSARASAEGPAPAPRARMVPATRGALSMDSAFQGIFSFGTAGKPKGGSG